MTHWTELNTMDSDGNIGTLDAASLEGADATFTEDGVLESWADMMVYADGETPDYLTPNCEVDWSGMQEAFNKANPGWDWDGATNYQSPEEFVALSGIKTEDDVRRVAGEYARNYPKTTSENITTRDVYQIQQAIESYLLERANELGIV